LPIGSKVHVRITSEKEVAVNTPVIRLEPLPPHLAARALDRLAMRSLERVGTMPERADQRLASYARRSEEIALMIAEERSRAHPDADELAALERMRTRINSLRLALEDLTLPPATRPPLAA
jgi:hypothetical protein